MPAFRPGRDSSFPQHGTDSINGRGICEVWRGHEVLCKWTSRARSLASLERPAAYDLRPVESMKS